ncbi:hypothetical protein EON81_20565 [bacterium]|nr:MAG: hypothetical protein EON81_20565 [bacterium]
MSTPSFVRRISAVLSAYPEAKVEAEELSIYVLPANDEGFTVLMFMENDVFSVYYNGWHQEFEDEETAIGTFMTGLTKQVRLIEVRRGGEAYRWTLETQTGDGWWTVSTTSLPYAPFWKRKRPVVLQNSLVKERVVERVVSENTDSAQE